MSLTSFGIQRVDADDVDDLGLDFTIADTSLGQSNHINLVPGGSAITVTAVRKASLDPNVVPNQCVTFVLSYLRSCNVD